MVFCFTSLQSGQHGAPQSQSSQGLTVLHGTFSCLSLNLPTLAAVVMAADPASWIICSLSTGIHMHPGWSKSLVYMMTTNPKRPYRVDVWYGDHVIRLVFSRDVIGITVWPLPAPPRFYSCFPLVAANCMSWLSNQWRQPQCHQSPRSHYTESWSVKVHWWTETWGKLFGMSSCLHNKCTTSQCHDITPSKALLSSPLPYIYIYIYT